MILSRVRQSLSSLLEQVGVGGYIRRSLFWGSNIRLTQHLLALKFLLFHVGVQGLRGLTLSCAVRDVSFQYPPFSPCPFVAFSLVLQTPERSFMWMCVLPFGWLNRQYLLQRCGRCREIKHGLPFQESLLPFMKIYRRSGHVGS